MENTNTKPTAAYSDGKREADIEAINLAAENVVTAFGSVQQIATRYGYPTNATNELLTVADELIRSFFLVANYVFNPAAADIVDAIEERKQKVSAALVKASAADEDEIPNFVM